MAIIFIALLHAAPVFLIGLYKRSRGWLIAAAIGSGILAASFGSEKYLYVDLLAIGVTVIWCWIALAPAYPKVVVEEPEQAPDLTTDQVPSQEPEPELVHTPVYEYHTERDLAPDRSGFFGSVALLLVFGGRIAIGATNSFKGMDLELNSSSLGFWFGAVAFPALLLIGLGMAGMALVYFLFRPKAWDHGVLKLFKVGITVVASVAIVAPLAYIGFESKPARPPLHLLNENGKGKARRQYDAALKRLESAYPVLNPDRAEFDGSVTNAVAEAYQILVRTEPPDEALQQAVHQVLGN